MRSRTAQVLGWKEDLLWIVGLARTAETVLAKALLSTTQPPLREALARFLPRLSQRDWEDSTNLLWAAKTGLGGILAGIAKQKCPPVGVSILTPGISQGDVGPRVHELILERRRLGGS